MQENNKIVINTKDIENDTYPKIFTDNLEYIVVNLYESEELYYKCATLLNNLPICLKKININLYTNEVSSIWLRNEPIITNHMIIRLPSSGSTCTIEEMKDKIKLPFGCKLEIKNVRCISKN